LTPSDFILAEQQVTDQRAKDQGKNQGVRESRISKEESTKKNNNTKSEDIAHIFSKWASLSRTTGLGSSS
jgi:hypothetical protein